MTDARPPLYAARLAQDWPQGAPDWVVALAEACDRIGQAEAGRRLGYSGSAISTVLKGRYGAGLGKIEAAVRGAFLAATVGCPILGEIPQHECLQHQRIPAEEAVGNQLKVRLFRACRSCDHAWRKADAHA